MVVLCVAAVVTAAVVAAVYGSHRRPGRHPTSAPVLDPRADQELRARYLDGRISIGVYLDRRFGTDFGSAGDRGPAG
jgi:hypothetical protein